MDSANSRRIDVALRLVISTLCKLNPESAPGSLQMFPTPPMSYFAQHLATSTCKPHLRFLGEELFGANPDHAYGPPTGGTFARFMIVGFATYQALEPVSLTLYESYPDLQFKLWRGNQVLLPKKGRHKLVAALISRINVISELASELDIAQPEIQHMDAADAAILALSGASAIRKQSTLIINHPAEGSFLLALTDKHAHALKQARN
jgi:hypothetical protein